MGLSGGFNQQFQGQNPGNRRRNGADYDRKNRQAAGADFGEIFGGFYQRRPQNRRDGNQKAEFHRPPPVQADQNSRTNC